MSPWVKRFGLHLAAAVGATGIFVAAAAVGANQTRTGQEQIASVAPTPTALVAPAPAERTPRPPIVRKPTASNPTPGAAAAPPKTVEPTPVPPALGPERSVAGAIRDVLPDGELVVQGAGGRVWRVHAAQGALIRLNGKATPLEMLHPGDTLVILGQPEVGQGSRLLAHAITARRK